MKKEFKDKVSKMDARYRHAYQDLDKIFKRMGEKDTYFIIQKVLQREYSRGSVQARF